MKCCHFNVIFKMTLPYRWEVWLLVLCFCCVVVLLLYVMCFPQFYFVAWICFFLNRFMYFEQRYTSVAFIYFKGYLTSLLFLKMSCTKQEYSRFIYSWFLYIFAFVFVSFQFPLVVEDFSLGFSF